LENPVSHTIDNLVYALLEPETGEVRYVGKSKHGLERPRQHRRAAHRERSHKATWIRALARKGQEPRILVLSHYETEDAAYAAEVEWIKLLRDCGVRLTNHNDGGRGGEGGKASDETRRKLSESRLGAKNHQHGKPQHPNNKAAVSAANKARKWTPEQKAARSQLMKQIQADPAVRAAHAAKTQKPVVAIRGLEVHWFPSVKATAALGFNPANVCNALKGRITQHKGFVWAYALPRP
jgi:hypothetical protein